MRYWFAALALAAMLCGPGRAQEPDKNFGLDLGKMSVLPRYTLNGEPVTKARAFEALGAPAFTKAKAHVTVIGSGPEIEAAKAGLPALAEGVAAHYYAPGHPLVAKHPQGGKPSVCVQDAAGKRLYEAGDAKGLPAALGKLGLTRDPVAPEPEPAPTPDDGPDPRPCPCPRPNAPRGCRYPWGLIAVGVAALFVAGGILRRR